MVLNLILLVIDFRTCGHEFGAKTVYTVADMPAGRNRNMKKAPPRSIPGGASFLEGVPVSPGLVC